MLVNCNDRYIGRCLSECGEFSRGEIELLAALLHEDSIVLDIGANIGSIAIPLGRICQSVIAFEPQEFLFHLLCANIALNSMVNVHPILAAITDKTGPIHIPKLDPRLPNNFGGVNLMLDAPRKTRVNGFRLDDMAISSCALIKCDVEGMEEVALRSGSRVLEELRPALYVENDRPENQASLFEFLLSTRRRLFSHFPRLIEDDNFLGTSADIFGEETLVSLNVLAWPEERTLPINLAHFGLEEITDPTAAFNPSGSVNLQRATGNG